MSFIDLIFRGNKKSVNEDFLDLFYGDNYIETIVHYPEQISILRDKNSFKKLIENFEYVDCVMVTSELSLKSIKVTGSFINIGVQDNKIELLISFNYKINNLKYSDSEIFNILEDWMSFFCKAYNFDYYLCRDDNGDSSEYFFDSFGSGPLRR